MTNYAAVDVGSNTIRLLIARFNGQLQPLLVERRITRLGEGVERSGRIRPEAVRRSLDCLSYYAREMHVHHVAAYRATATEALRKAANAWELIDLAWRECRLHLGVITAQEEARLTLTGVSQAIGRHGGNWLVFDLGGGSTEFIFNQASGQHRVKSLNLGVVSLTERFLKKEDPPGEKSLLALQDHIRKVLAPVVREIKTGAGSIELLVGTAGTVTTLAAMLQKLPAYDPGLINRYVLERNQLQSLYQSMVRVSREERARMPGLEPGRADIIPAGALTVLEIMKAFAFEEMLVSDAGLLEGIIYSLVPGGPFVQENPWKKKTSQKH